MTKITMITCTCCKELVQDYEYIDELEICRDCWTEENGSYTGHDQAEVQRVDR